MDSTQLYWVKSDQDYGPDHYVNEIFLKTNIIPTQCYFVNDNSALFVKFPQGTEIDKWHNTKNLKSLNNMGLTPKLSSFQLDKNSVFINSAPEAIFNQTTEALLEHINEANPNILALSAYVPPKRGHFQKLGSVKLTLVTRNMVNSVLSYGIRIAGCHIEPGSIRQAHYLKEQQCTFCYHFHHGKCQAEFPNCPNCSQHHSRHQCREKEFLKCINCRMPHKATSNNCRIRNNMLTSELINDIDLNTIICPFGKVIKQGQSSTPTPPNISDSNSSDWPPINNKNISAPTSSASSWGISSVKNPPANNMMNPLIPLAPMTTYYDVLRMSLMFDNWYSAFISLMGIFGLPAVEFPPQLRAQLKGKDAYRGPSDTIPPHSANMLNPTAPTIPNQFKSNHTLSHTQPGLINELLSQHNEAQPNSPHIPPLHTSQESFPLTGANTVPLSMRTKKDTKGYNKSTKGKGLLPTPTDPLLPTSLSLAPSSLKSFSKPSPITSTNINNTNSNKGLQWGDDPDDTVWKTSPEDKPTTPEPALDMPYIEGTQILNTTHTNTNKKERLSMDINQFKSTIENFENLSSLNTSLPTQSKHTSQTQHLQPKQPVTTKQQKTNFHVGSNKKISPKPKAVTRQHYKHSTPSPQKEGICTSSETETDSDEEIDVDDVQQMVVNELDDTLEDLTKTNSASIPPRRQLRSNSNSTTKL